MKFITFLAAAFSAQLGLSSAFDNNWQVSIDGSVQQFKFLCTSAGYTHVGSWYNKTWSANGSSASFQGTQYSGVEGIGPDKSADNTGGFGEYANDFKAMASIRRPPGFKYTIKKNTGFLVFSGTFATWDRLSPPNTLWLTGDLSAATATKITKAVYTRSAKKEVSLRWAKPAMIVRATNNSWSWKSPLTVESYAEGILPVKDGQLGPAAELSKASCVHELVCEVPIPKNWTGDVEIWFTGFVTSWSSTTRSYTAAYTVKGKNGSIPESWTESTQNGVAMGVMNLTGGKIVPKPPPLEGSFTLPSLIARDRSGDIPSDFTIHY